MALAQAEKDYLQEQGLPFSMTEEQGMTCIVFPAFSLPGGYNLEVADLLIRLSPGFPDVPPDMWWFAPALARVDAREIPATQYHETHLGRVWQRWSRHLASNQWMLGTDSLQSFFAIIRKDLERNAPELVT